MNPEYVKISAPELVFGEKTLLYSQLSMLNIIKRNKNFIELRKDELAMKIAFKNKIEEIRNDIDLIQRTLPKPVMKETKEKIPEPLIKRPRSTLEDEINEIKRKLTKLQA